MMADDANINHLKATKAGPPGEADAIAGHEKSPGTEITSCVNLRQLSPWRQEPTAAYWMTVQW